MSNDFDFMPEFDFEDDFADELADFDDSIEEDESVTLRTAVLQKNHMVALLCIKSASVGAAICRVDPRETLPAVQLYDDRDAAVQWFNRSLSSSKKNGWNIVYDGLPLQG
jgi:hypothetical protein